MYCHLELPTCEVTECSFDWTIIFTILKSVHCKTCLWIYTVLQNDSC